MSSVKNQGQTSCPLAAQILIVVSWFRFFLCHLLASGVTLLFRTWVDFCQGDKRATLTIKSIVHTPSLAPGSSKLYGICRWRLHLKYYLISDPFKCCSETENYLHSVSTSWPHYLLFAYLSIYLLIHLLIHLFIHPSTHSPLLSIHLSSVYRIIIYLTYLPIYLLYISWLSIHLTI